MTAFASRQSFATQVDGQKEVEASGATVGEVVDDLVARYPRLREQLLTSDGELHRFVNVYLNGQDVRYLAELDTPVGDATRSIILPAMAGGSIRSVKRHRGATRPSIDAIGHTPLVELARFSPNPSVRLLAKLEGINPTGSVKDRVARYLIEGLERVGPARSRLDHPRAVQRQHRHLAGHDLPAQGYRLTVVMPDNVTRERRQLLELYGAEIIDRRLSSGSNGAVALARKMAGDDPRYVMPDQYANPANPRRTTRRPAAEIIADCPELDVFVAGLGTGGTLMGVGRRLREASARTCASTPPSRCPARQVQGLRSLDEGFVPEIFDPSVLDGSSSSRPRSRSKRCAADRDAREFSPAFRRVACWPSRRGWRSGWSPARSSRCWPTAAGSTYRRTSGRATWKTNLWRG